MFELDGRLLEKSGDSAINVPDFRDFPGQPRNYSQIDSHRRS